MKKTLTTCLLASVSALSGYVYANNVPKGWAQNTLTMGTIYDNSSAAKKGLLSYPVSSVFTYAGQNGAGDRGTIVQPTKIQNTVNQLGLSAYRIKPVFVIYTANASGGGSGQALVDITNYQDLVDHYVNLMLADQQLEVYAKRSQLAVRSTVVLNPDFIGNLHKGDSNHPGGYNPNAPLPHGISGGPKSDVTFRDALNAAIQLWQQKQKISQSPVLPTIPAGLGSANTLADYVQTINWIMGAFSPDVTYGWEDADWAGQTDGNLWLHQATNDQAMMPKNISGEVSYLKAMHVFTPITLSNGQVTAPSFIAFDKYGANPVSNGNYANFLNEGYLFNSDDWHNYVAYVSGVSAGLDNAPVMLFQMPGAHLPSTTAPVEVDPYFNVASAPDYFFGDPGIVPMTSSNKIPGTIKNCVYYFKQPASGLKCGSVADISPSQYLSFNHLNDGESAWKTSRLSSLVKDHVFAILWGGGAYATGVIPQSGDTFDDQGWLYHVIQTNYSTGLVAKPQKRVVPPASQVPVYQAGKSYFVGEMVTINHQYPIYQCKVSSWCTEGGLYAPGKQYDSLAWNLLNKPAS